ncbi:MAG TPA: helix-turn-helix transcriptional regulator [Acidimicrobiales bacterium]|nr:helix-turn-helix transcriptional regulator [Acidimicrobiales bacterium]
MKPPAGYSWRLRPVMAAHGLWKTSDLGPLLAERGVVLSAAQVYRLAAQIPERLSLRTLSALCDIFACTPNDLIELGNGTAAGEAPAKDNVVDLATVGRPRRARVDPGRK